MKKKLKIFFHYLLAFLIPVSIFLLAMYLMDLYPFGDTSMRISDAYIQYPAFFEGLKDGDLFTFKIGLGTNFYTIWTTYLASPLSLLYLFFENYQFDIFFVILVLLKIGLIGLNMNILLNYKKTRSIYSTIFSTTYALSGFVALYYWNYQFLDALYMLPLIMIGIEKLVNDNKNLMYFITLTLMIIFHYYTAYMICIFSVIYFFFLLINSELNKKVKRKRVVKFFVTSLFCGLCSSFVMIPSIYSFIQGRGNYSADINYFAFNKEFLSMFYNLGAGSALPIDLGNFSAPVFITIFIIISLIYVFFDKNVTKKYKLSLLGIIIVYLLSLSFNLIYFGWHVFNVPQGLPGRFVFCFNCFFVFIAYRNFRNSINIKTFVKIIIAIMLIVIIVVSLVYKLNLYNLTFYTVDKRYIILVIFNILLIIYYVFLLKNNRLFLLTFFLIFLELLINLICSFNINFALFEYRTISVNEEKNKIEKMNNLLNLENNDFHRNEYTSNSGLFFGFNSVSHYSSIYNNNLVSFIEEYSNGTPNYVILYDNNYLLNGILGVKNIYNYSDNEIKKIENYYYINSLGFMIKENEFIYSQLVDSKIIDICNGYTSNKLLKINTYIPEVIFNNVELKEDAFVLINNEELGQVIIEYKITENSLIDFEYKNIFFINNIVDGKKILATEIIDLYINDKKVDDVLYLNKGDDFKIIISIPKELNAILAKYVYFNFVNSDIYKQVMNELNENIIENIEFNSFGFKGELNVSNDKNLLLLTIPYDENINIYVNDKKHKFKKIFNGIIGLNLEKGDYTIEFRYSVKGLKLGIIVSISSFVIFSCLKILEKKYITSYNNIDNKEEIYR